MNKERTLGKLALAGAMAFGGFGASAANPEDTSSATVRAYNCNATLDKWYPLTKGEIVVIKASGAVIPADETVDGVKQYDNLGETATIVGLKSSDNTNKTWVINNDNSGSVLVLRCGATFGRTRTALGTEASKLDAGLGANNPAKSVQLQWIKK